MGRAAAETCVNERKPKPKNGARRQMRATRCVTCMRNSLTLGRAPAHSSSAVAAADAADVSEADVSEADVSEAEGASLLRNGRRSGGEATDSLVGRGRGAAAAGQGVRTKLEGKYRRRYKHVATEGYRKKRYRH